MAQETLVLLISFFALIFKPRDEIIPKHTNEANKYTQYYTITVNNPDHDEDMVYSMILHGHSLVHLQNLRIHANSLMVQVPTHFHSINQRIHSSQYQLTNPVIVAIRYMCRYSCMAIRLCIWKSFGATNQPP